MNIRLSQSVAAAEGRYLTPAERRDLLAYGESLPRRLKAAAAVARIEDEVAIATAAEMKQRYPNFGKLHDYAWEKCHRDLVLVVRAGVHAMTLDDMAYVEDRVLYWLRTILSASNFTPGFVRETYQSLREGFKKKLPADAYALMEPYFEKFVAVISDFPEPANPAV